MPVYPGSGKATLLNTNQQKLLFNAERILSGTASIAVQLERQKSAFYPFGASLEISFSAPPGVFQVDVETADTDQDANFVAIQSLTTGLNTSNVARVELPSFWAKYIRCKAVTLTNDVLTTIQVTR